MNRYINIIIIVAFCSLFMIGGLIWHHWPDQYVRIIFCDVGQGDAILITSGFFQLLVDGGPNDAVLNCLNDHMPFWDRHIEWVILTHGHSDHVAGLNRVMQRYSTDIILTNGTDYQTEVLAEFYELINEHLKRGSQWIIAEEGQTGNIHDIVIVSVLAPEVISVIEPHKLNITEEILSDMTRGKEEVFRATKSNENSLSIVLKLDIGQVSILLTGDLESPEEQALIKRGLIHEVNILKVAHHGSKSSSISDFIEKTAPELAVISCGQNNRYQHPSPEVMTRFDLFGAKIWRTDQDGSLVIITDGTRYWY